MQKSGTESPREKGFSHEQQALQQQGRQLRRQSAGQRHRRAGEQAPDPHHLRRGRGRHSAGHHPGHRPGFDVFGFLHDYRLL